MVDHAEQPPLGIDDREIDELVLLEQFDDLVMRRELRDHGVHGL